MHAAPSVAYPVGSSRFALGALALAWLAGVVATLAWAWQSQDTGWRHALALAVVAAGGLLAGLAWLRSPSGTLAWGGDAWSWHAGTPDAPPEAGQPAIACDLQSRMLLLWRAEEGRARWLVVERRMAALHWDALRRAVYSRARAGAPHGAQPPVPGR